jgi:hypothetical protein
MMWDDDNLYLLVEITDDEIDVSSPNGWENDGIQIYFDGDNSKDVLDECPSDFPGAYDEDDYQLTAVFVQNSTQAGRIPGQVDLCALDFEYQQQHKEVTIEAALPFDALLVPLQVTSTIGYCFGFELQVNDRD